MPLQSQNLKKCNHISALPEYWSEDDKTNYELLVADAKRYFPYMDEYVIHIGVVAEINKHLGKGVGLDEEKAKELMDKYKDNRLEYVTPFDPDFDFKATMEELLIINDTQKKCEHIIEEDKDDEINESN